MQTIKNEDVRKLQESFNQYFGANPNEMKKRALKLKNRIYFFGFIIIEILSSLMSFSNKKQTIFLHCLPRGDEVSDDIFLGKKSHVWQQALNRVHVQKSILLYCFGKLR